MGMVEDVLFLSLFRSEKKVSENSKEVFFGGYTSLQLQFLAIKSNPTINDDPPRIVSSD